MGLGAYIFIIILAIVFHYIIQSQDNDERNAKISQFANLNQTYMQQVGFNADAQFIYENNSDKINIQILVDNHNDKIMLFHRLQGTRSELNFKDILGMEFKVDGVGSDGVGRAAVGGLLFGGTGAMIGALTGNKKVQDVKIVIYVNDVVHPSVEILLNHENVIRCDSYQYKKISEFENRMEATIRAIISKNESGTAETTQSEFKITENEEKIHEINPDSKLADEAKNFKSIDYFLMYDVQGLTEGRNNLRGLLCLNGLAVNSNNIIGKQIDLYNDNLELITSTQVVSMSDFSNLTPNRMSVHLSNLKKDGLPKIAFAVESGKEINDVIIENAIKGVYNTNMAS